MQQFQLISQYTYFRHNFDIKAKGLYVFAQTIRKFAHAYLIFISTKISMKFFLLHLQKQWIDHGSQHHAVMLLFQEPLE